MNERRRAAGAVAVAGLLAAASAGCSEEYMLRADHLAAARTLSETGTSPQRIAILATAPAGEPRFLRYQRLPLLAVAPGQAARVRMADSHAQRVAGTTLFVIGLAHLAGLAAHIGFEVVSARSCAASPTCYGEDFSLIFTGPILGTLGFSMLIPGIVLMAQGYGAPRDVKAGRADFTYVGDPSLRPPGP